METDKIHHALGIVSQASRMEPGLLAKTTAELIAQWEHGLTVLRFNATGEIIGHATLWPLLEEPAWYELGTVWVDPYHRGHDLSAEIYRDLFASHPERNILGTTIIPASIRIGKRVGMRMIPFSALPEVVRAATCICPIKKTGTSDNRHCQLREQYCFVRVTEDTWRRMGCPPTLWHPMLGTSSPELDAPASQ